MDRRSFLSGSLAAAAIVQGAGAQANPGRLREYYQVRRYTLLSGPQIATTEKYISDALIPALARRGSSPVGAFRLEIGPETPAFYVLIPIEGGTTTGTLEEELNRDDTYIKLPSHSGVHQLRRLLSCVWTRRFWQPSRDGRGSRRRKKASGSFNSGLMRVRAIAITS
jgi:hypothetical protein